MLETQRLILRPWGRDDIQRLMEIAAQPHILRWLPDWDGGEQWIPGWIDRVREHDRLDNPYEKFISRAVALKSTGQVIAQISLGGEIPGALGLGYFIDAAHAGHGYISEAVEAMADRAFERYRCAYVFATIQPDNLPSANLVKRLGFRYIKTEVEHQPYQPQAYPFDYFHLEREVHALRKKQYILFDLDGTIVDSYPGISRSVRYALRSMDLPVPEDAVLRQFVGPPLKESFQRYCGLDDADSDLAVARYREDYAAGGMLQSPPYPGMLNLLRELKGAGKAVILATAKPHRFARLILEHIGALELFDFLSGSELDGARTDKAESIAYALEHCSIGDTGRAVMVGDRRHDVVGALKTGVDCIGALYGYGGRDELLAAGARECLLAGDAAHLSRMLLGRPLPR